MSADQQPNGYEITKWAERCKVGTPTLKLILLLLALKANAKGPHPGYCYCKHETLAEAAECSRETVVRYIKILAEAGFIAVRAQCLETGYRTNSEFLVLYRDGLTWPDETNRRDERSRRDVTTDHVEGDERSRTYVTRDHVGRDERSQQKNPIRTLTSTLK